MSIKRLKARLWEKISEYAQYQVLHKATCFYFIRATEKKLNELERFLSVAGEWWRQSK